MPFAAACRGLDRNGAATAIPVAGSPQATLQASGASQQPNGIAPPGYPELIYDIAMHPTRAGRLWITTGSRVLRYTALGQTLDEAATIDAKGPFITSVEQPAPDRLYVGGAGSLERSPDDGVTWAACGSLAVAEVKGLAADPDVPERVYALVAPGQIERSDDGCLTWRQVASGLPPAAFGLWVLGTAPLRMAVFDHSEGVLLKSDDDGVTWAEISAPTLGTRPYQIARASDGRLYAATSIATYVSLDRGETWTPRGPPLTGTAVGVLPTDPDIVVMAAADGSIVRSADGGVTWLMPGRPQQP